MRQYLAWLFFFLFGLSAAPLLAQAPTASTAATTQTSTATTATSAEPTASPAATPTAAADPHHSLPPGHPSAEQQPTVQLVEGTPFASQQHRRQASMARSGRQFQPETQVQSAKMLPAGTVGVLVKDADGNPLAGKKVRLKITKQSIAEGDKLSEKESLTDAQGRAGFMGRNTESSFIYEVEVEEQGATYTSGEFRLKPEFGHVVSLVVYPSTQEISETFIVSRALYVIQPRVEHFQIQAMLRIHNTNPVTWLPGGLPIQLPEGWQAFQPGETSGDLKLSQKNGEVVVDGSFIPGQHDFSFGFQLPNEQTETARLRLPTTPNLVDARVFLEASREMELTVDGFEPATETRGTDGQHALLSTKDFLQASSGPPETISVIITGLPTAGWSQSLAYVIAAAIALLGLGLAVSWNQKSPAAIAGEDNNRAKELLLEELVVLDRAFKNEEIGPKTYEQTRRTLLDSLARLEAQSPKSGEPSAEHKSKPQHLTS